MHFIKTYKNAQTARMNLQTALNQMGFKLSDVTYEIKKVRNSGYHAVLSQENGKHLTRSLERQGFVVTH